ncbi:MAG TPA: PASTA domain-containing protein [Streptosporangiaceae bacterium]|nr:PASTA domain-containing protein [Streptosporangiaceae bacterium]
MDTALSPPVGQLLGGRYHVGSRIARGGMATVYLGTDTRLDRVVALKIAHPDLSDDFEFVRRFIGEARSAARLTSPNVVAVYDQGSDNRVHYIAMEYVAGRTLRQLLAERGRLGAREALGIMTGVLTGLAAAHQAGLAHRDVKPENVLLTKNGEVKVADFGLARSVAGAVQTKGGMLIGTAAYLAPEQVSGGVSDARTDVYAAGVMLFELLTGRQPHTGESPLAVAYKHVNEIVPAPSSVLPGLAPALDALVAMATSRDPELRPMHAGQFLRAINEVRDSLNASAPYQEGHPYPRRPNSGQYSAPYGRDSLDYDMPGYEPRAVGASALPSLSPHSAPLDTPHPSESAGVNHTLVVPAGSDYNEYLQGSVSRYSDPYGANPPADTGYRGHRASGRRGSRGSEPWLQSLLFGRRLVYLIGGIAVIAAVGGTTWWLSSGQYTNVPVIRGMSLSAAKLALNNVGLKIKLAKPEHYSMPRGEIITTSPKAGARVTGGTVVTITTSLGPLILQVPDVSGQPEAQAEDALRHANLIPGTVTKATSGSVPVGDVISTTPAAYTKWPQDKPVGLTISEGPGLANFVGQPVDAAVSAAGSGGFTINQVPAKSNQPAGTVLTQSPKANTPITPGEVVTVRVSQGPPAIAVPNVQGMPLHDAIQALEQAGFQIQINQGLGDKVLSYAPTTPQPKGTTITLNVGLFSGG